MNLWRQLKSLDISALWALLKLCLRHPFRVIPTIRATRECVSVCDQHFGKTHHRNSPANAFRHALWNYYIARECNKGDGGHSKILEWTKKITDWHEVFSKNDFLAREMDLHNNRLGRLLFGQDPNMEAEEIITLLKSKLTTSIKISTPEDLQTVDKLMFVHLIDPKIQ
ncbi:MAG: hypothetical protein KJO94_00225 [Eudoraea sp.]|nr:hypothetical protein [Eudoraea sp.]MBT8321875.1 hypothetical protein [Eudoraea sp.]NNJ39083.1 hypothetical protein [Flavobacteriaceae bacterium]